MNSLVSVVIPVFKTEAWLRRCIASVSGQRYPHLEILLVDDGSPDGCGGICNAAAAADSRIRVIHKENEGLGMARNTGIEEARGRYVCFVDSDDCLENTAVGDALALAEKEQAEIVLYGMTSVDSSGKRRQLRLPETEKAVYSGSEVQGVLLPRLLSGQGGLVMSACCCLISMELVRRTGWRFPSERRIISEDVYALLELFQHISTAAVLRAAPYRYYETPQSLTRTFREDRFSRNLAFYRACLALCGTCHYSREVRRRCAEPFVSNVIAAMKQEAAILGRASLPRLKAMLAEEELQQALREVRGTGWKRRLLLCCLRRRWHRLAYLLLRAQNRIQ